MPLSVNQSSMLVTPLTMMVNGLLFNISWLAIVYTQSDFWAPIIVASHLLIHFAFFARGYKELRFILAVTIFGVVVDQLLFALGLFTVAGVASAAPLWLSCLWPVLATTFMHAFSAFQQRVLFSAVVGAFGGTSSYIFGVSLSELNFASNFWGPLSIAVLWAMLFPGLVAIAKSVADLPEGARYANP